MAFPFINYSEKLASQRGSLCWLLVSSTPQWSTWNLANTQWAMNRTAAFGAAKHTAAWSPPLLICLLTDAAPPPPPSSSTPQGVMTNSWGGWLFSNPNGNGDVQTVCYYLLCSWSEPRYLTTHSPSVSHSHFSLPIGPLSYLIGLCVTHWCAT